MARYGRKLMKNMFSYEEVNINYVEEWMLIFGLGELYCVAIYGWLNHHLKL